jgi:hypothetical protein
MCVCVCVRVCIIEFGCAIAQMVSRRLPTAPEGFDHTSGHVGFMVDEEAMRRVFYEYFGFPCQFSFHQLLHIK